jgi:hypothetical protein
MTSLLYCIFFCLFVIAVVLIIKESRVTAAENAERGRMRVEQEQTDIVAADEWLRVTTACPECKTTDGIWRDENGALITHYDCMDVCYNYCDDPYGWHAAHCNCGTYGGKSQQQAKIEIGQRLRRRNG